MKRFLAFLLAAVMLLSMTACGSTATASGSSKTQEFTDSTGRTVTIPAEITKIAITGPLSQVYILPLAGDMLVGVCNEFSADAALYLPEEIFNKTEIGQLYGGKGEMDLEALLTAAPDLVIDIGEPKDSIGTDLTALTEQTGIPFVHVDATVQTAPEAYRTLGKLLGREDKAEELAQWCEKTYQTITVMMEKVDTYNARNGLLYCLGDKGTNVIAEGSFHAETINMVSRNLAVIEDVFPGGLGNEVDLEQILLWNPEIVIFAPDSCYHAIAGDPQWQSVSAVAKGNYFKTPDGPYGWLSSPPAVQRYLGMLWLGELLYPDYTDYNLQEEITEYYKLFYGCDLTDDMYQNLIADALPK